MVTTRRMPAARASASTCSTGSVIMSRWQWLSSASAGSAMSGAGVGPVRRSGVTASPAGPVPRRPPTGASLANSGVGGCSGSARPDRRVLPARRHVVVAGDDRVGRAACPRPLPRCAASRTIAGPAEHLVDPLGRARQERAEQRLGVVHRAAARRGRSCASARGRFRAASTAPGRTGTCWRRPSSACRGDGRLEPRPRQRLGDLRERLPGPLEHAPGRGSVSVPGGGIDPMLRAANDTALLTRLPQLATSSSLLRRTNSAQVKSVSWFSGPATAM